MTRSKAPQQPSEAILPGIQSRQFAWETLNQNIIACTACERLISYCQQVATTKRRAYRDQEYWGRPVPNFGDANGRLLIVGLAPGAHGANRTGRMFTGDRSGDWLFRALEKVGFANQATSEGQSDGLQLSDCAITNACHCAPPANKPLTEEITHCRTWLAATFELLPTTVILALGGLAWRQVLDFALGEKWIVGRRPKFAHGAQVPLGAGRTLLGSYHPSQQNTFTGRLTEEMFDSVFTTAKKMLHHQG